jgi:NTP pyrophosphatase (non-canonical NTP hydrolase)
LSITLFPGCDQYAADLKLFFDAMMFKLYKNRHKGHWNNKYSLDSAYRALEVELRELHDSLRTDNLFHLIEECADVANFALILASVAMRQVAWDMDRGVSHDGVEHGRIDGQNGAIQPGPVPGVR